jgi:signal transduction histidine kinase/ActR/RegA family two-component response regulator
VSEATGELERRVLLLLPTARDNRLACEVLERGGVPSAGCRDAHDLADRLAQGAAAVVVGEEWLPRGVETELAQVVARQPQWSDLPVLVMARTGVDSPQVARAIAQLGNVTVLERPIRLASLVTAVGSAVRARQRQYELREYLQSLANARNELADVARAKDEFLATLGHELRNPLAPMRSALAVLDDARTPAARRAELQALLVRQVNHMVHLVDDLIDVSRLTRGSIELRPQRIDLRDAISSAIELSQPLITARRHRLDVAMDGGPFWIEADVVRLTQVISNLLNNSAKYSPPGGEIRVSVTVEGDDTDGGEIRLEVADNGVGIEPDVLPRVFDMFTQGRDIEHRAQDGLGIGLTLVKRLVQLHGGRIRAASEGKGCGAQFVVHLPRAAAAGLSAVSAPRPGGADEAGRRSLRVLIVDDNRDAAETLGMVLELMGIERRLVHSGPEALDVLADAHADVVLLDIGMPGMDGYEVARRIRSSEALRKLPLIALTGWGQLDDVRRTREAGFDHHLTKPVDLEHLTALLDTIGAARAA